MIEKKPFGQTPSGETAFAYELVCNQTRARVSDFGATLLSLECPDPTGATADIVLGFANISDYAGENGACYGGTIGPVANRTDRAEVPLGACVYHLTQNDGPTGENNLHSDLERGLHKRLWSARPNEDSNSMTFTTTLSDGELGLPGNRTFSARYSLEEKDGATELTVTYGCTTDAATYVNMTNHSYFNLSGHASGTVREEMATIDADFFLPVREDSVSEGEIRPVDGTPFDFRAPRAFGEHIDDKDVQIERARGYDHCFCVRGHAPGAAPRHALHVEDLASGRVLDISITAPGAHLYTGNWLSDSNVKDAASYSPQSGFAFEPEFYPDCVHHPDWPQSVCTPESPYSSTIVYRLSTR